MLKIDKFLLYLATFETLCFSGAPKLLVHEGVCAILWVLTGILIWHRTALKDKVAFNRNIKIAILLIAWTCITSVILNTPEDNHWMAYSLIPFGGAFIISSYSFQIYRNALFKSLNVLLVTSLIVHFLHNLGFIPATFDGNSTYFSLYFFNVQWGWFETLWMDIYRFSAIYWEPGQLQVVLTYVLCLYIDVLQKYVHNIKFLLLKFGIVIFSYLMTFSTTGFVVLAIIAFVTFSFSGSSNSKIFAKIISIAMAFIVVHALLNSRAVQDKFEQRNSNEITSYSIRMTDALVALNIALDNPIFGAGLSSHELKSAYQKTGRESSSNGWLNSSASLGFPYVIFLIVFVYRGLKRMYKKKLLSLFVLAALVLSQANESQTYYPYMWLYIYSFSRFV